MKPLSKTMRTVILIATLVLCAALGFAVHGAVDHLIIFQCFGDMLNSFMHPASPIVTFSK